MASSSDHEKDSDAVEGTIRKKNYVKKDVKHGPIRKIKVTKLPAETTDDIVINYFENRRRNGGGPIKSIEYHPATSSAIIEFEEAEAVNRVLKKRPLIFLKKQISVEKYFEEVWKEEEELSCRTVEVRGFAENTIEEVLVMYFENSKRSGGSDITRIEVENGVALITFADEGVAKNVAKHKHIVAGCHLDVKLYVLPRHKSAKMLSQPTNKESKKYVPHCTIEVGGVTKNILDTLLFYFENKKRSGGDEIVNFEYKDDGIAYITFESEEVAKRVVSHGQHKVDGKSLDVKLYIPPQPKPTYNDRVLLAGFIRKVSQDHLSIYMEAKMGLTPVQFLYGEDDEKVLITFEETIDFEKLIEACKKWPLEGSYLYPSKVHISNCIIISNLKISTSEDTIVLYFENEKRSRGGPVVKVELNREEEYCLVFFEDHSICERVLHQKHIVDGSELQLSIFYECLGLYFIPPKPVKLKGLDFAKMQFLMKSEPMKAALEKQLHDCYTEIQWPQKYTDYTILTCKLTYHVRDCKKKALTWAQQAEQNLHDFLNILFVHELRVFKEIFETVLQNIHNLTIANPDGVALLVKNAEFSIQVVGHKAVATVVVKDIEDIIKKAESDFDRKKKRTKVTLNSMKYYQLKLLHVQNYPSQIEQQFNGLKVRINLNKNEIVFEGLMEDIRTAQAAVYEAVHNAAVSKLQNIPEGRLFLYKSKEVKDYIVDKLKNKKLVAGWDVEGSNLTIYASSDEAVIQSSQIIYDSVKEHQRDLESNQRSVVESQQWNDTVKYLDKQYQGKLNIILAPDFSKLFLYFTGDISGAVIKKVNDFLLRNNIFEKIVTCKSGTIQLIERESKDELDIIAKDLTQYYVQIIIQPQRGFLVRGNQEGIDQVTYRLQELVNRVKHRDHNLKGHGIAGYMEDKGREHISAVENQIPCVIQIRGQEQYGLGELEEETDSFDHSKDEFVDAAQEQRLGAKQSGIWGILRRMAGESHEQALRKVLLKSPQPMSPVEQSSTVWIDVYAWKKQTLDAAINKLDNLIKNDFSKADCTEPIVTNCSHPQEN